MVTASVLASRRSACKASRRRSTGNLAGQRRRVHWRTSSGANTSPACWMGPRPTTASSRLVLLTARTSPRRSYVPALPGTAQGSLKADMRLLRVPHTAMERAYGDITAFTVTAGPEAMPTPSIAATAEARTGIDRAVACSIRESKRGVTYALLLPAPIHYHSQPEGRS